jgi:hypothetical protein
MPLPNQQDTMKTVSSLSGTTQAQQPTITTALPTKNSYGNDMTLANRMNAGADQMRASRESAGGGLSRPEAPSYDPFSRPGDGNGDSQKRQQEYEGLLRQAADPRNGSARERAVMVQAAQGMLSPGLNLVQQQGQDYQSQLSAYDQAMKGGYGGSAPPGGDPSALINGLAKIFGPQEASANPTAPAIPAPTTMETTTPAIASALPDIEQSDGSSAGSSASALEMIEQQQRAHKAKQEQEAIEWEQIAQESSNNFRNIGAKNSSIRRIDVSDLVSGVLL